MISDTPEPAPSSSTLASWAPVPAAATIPTGPRRTTFAKPRPDAAEHRRAALGPHHEPAALGAAALERDLVLDGDVVGEQEDVHVARERAVRLERRVLAGHRDQGHVALGGGQRARRRLDDLVRLRGLRQLALGRVERLVRAVDGDHDVRGRGVDVEAELLEIGRRAHDQLAGGHAVAARARVWATFISRTLST